MQQGLDAAVSARVASGCVGVDQSLHCQLRSATARWLVAWYRHLSATSHLSRVNQAAAGSCHMHSHRAALALLVRFCFHTAPPRVTQSDPLARSTDTIIDGIKNAPPPTPEGTCVARAQLQHHLTLCIVDMRRTRIGSRCAPAVSPSPRWTQSFAARQTCRPDPPQDPLRP